MHIEEKIEHDIDPQLQDEITRLRNDCFPEDSKERSYFKQLPHFRFLAFEDEILVGQMGIDHRMISVGNSVFSIFGVIDLCIATSYRNRGIASEFLVADDHRLYQKNGFQFISTDLTWLKIDEHINYGVGRERFENELMVKQTGKKIWPDGPVDLLGYLF